MLDFQVIRYLLDLISSRVAEARSTPGRGDVAEKIVLVGIFVLIALTVGLVILHAVTGEAGRIARQIAGAP